MLNDPPGDRRPRRRESNPVVRSRLTVEVPVFRRPGATHGCTGYNSDRVDLGDESEPPEAMAHNERSGGWRRIGRFPGRPWSAGGLMVQFENQYRQIKVKIVYYGPALGGKTTCLQHIHRVTDPQRRTRLYSLNTASDRTLFFDLLSLNLGRIRGYRLAIQLYTVPGQVQYNATRRAVLAGADGVVFVADSQLDQHRGESPVASRISRRISRPTGSIPGLTRWCCSTTRGTLANLVPSMISSASLNGGGLPSFPTVAITGDGVMEAFAAITETHPGLAGRSPRHRHHRSCDRATQAADPSRPRTVRHGLGTVGGPPTTSRSRFPSSQPDETGPLPQETLVREAVRANLAMTDLSSQLEIASRQLATQRRSSPGPSSTSAAPSPTSETRPMCFGCSSRPRCLSLGVQAATVLIVPAAGTAARSGRPRRRARSASRDRWWRRPPMAGAVAEAGEPVLIASDLDGATAGSVQTGGGRRRVSPRPSRCR